MNNKSGEGIYRAVIVQDDLAGSQIKLLLYLEPPLKSEAEARAIEAALGSSTELITLKDDIGRTKFVLRDTVLQGEKAIIAKLNEAVLPYGHAVKPLEELPLELTPRNYAALISLRQWEAAA
ncbi:MAG TPA: hypothetical protein VH234_01495 [Candidatus Saccharimonadales bacterium]|jgi:hypothetical protein|nr:hypothetical protein [Candidatus Saccharimonadales bacterium]